MKIENQVCTLEQAKKLNKLGVKQGCSLFFFDTWMADKNKLQFNSSHSDGDYKDAQSCFSAFSVAELGVMLPMNLFSEDKKYSTEVYKYDVSDEQELENIVWSASYSEPFQLYAKSLILCEPNLTQAQAMAELLIKVIELKYDNVESINERLKTS